MPKSIGQWLIATLTLLVVALGTWGLGSVSSGREGLARVETRVNNLERQYTRIEEKLDRLLERIK